MGVSSDSLPRSTCCMAQAPVIALVIEAIQTTVSAVIGSPEGSAALAVATLEDRAISRRSRGDDAGHVARIGGLFQHCRNIARVRHLHSSLLGWLWRWLKETILSPFALRCNFATLSIASRVSHKMGSGVTPREGRSPKPLSGFHDEFYVIGQESRGETGTAEGSGGFLRRLSSPRWDECGSDFSFSSGLSARRRRLPTTRSALARRHSATGGRTRRACAA